MNLLAATLAQSIMPTCIEELSFHGNDRLMRAGAGACVKLFAGEA